LLPLRKRVIATISPLPWRERVSYDFPLPWRERVRVRGKGKQMSTMSKKLILQDLTPIRPHGS